MKVVVIEENRKCMGEFYSGDLLKGKAYDVISIEKDGRWYRIIDESGEDCIYPKDLFIIVEE